MQLCAPGKFRKASREVADAAVGVLVADGVLLKDSAVGASASPWYVVPRSVTAKHAQFNRALHTVDGTSVTLRHHSRPDSGPSVVGSVGFQGGGEPLQLAFARALDNLQEVPPPPPSPPTSAGVWWRPPSPPAPVRRHVASSGRRGGDSRSLPFAPPPTSVSDAESDSVGGWCECLAAACDAFAAWARRR